MIAITLDIRRTISGCLSAGYSRRVRRCFRDSNGFLVLLCAHGPEYTRKKAGHEYCSEQVNRRVFYAECFVGQCRPFNWIHESPSLCGMRHDKLQSGHTSNEPRLALPMKSRQDLKQHTPCSFQFYARGSENPRISSLINSSITGGTRIVRCTLQDCKSVCFIWRRSARPCSAPPCSTGTRAHSRSQARSTKTCNYRARHSSRFCAPSACRSTRRHGPTHMSSTSP